ncbi:MAG: acetate--CoA ligase [Sorangiineae bacterium NIC37A_2]|jgi:acetyl-CoA synthetase|nr:MAG: acetate--CoA ligase [Sorangiineae bacterium NIC37A_2]
MRNQERDTGGHPEHEDHGNQKFPPPEAFRARARVRDLEHFQHLYRESLEDPDTFWRRETEDLLVRRHWTKLREWKLPKIEWFVGGELNVSESCLDRFLEGPTADKVALRFEGEPGETRSLTYRELHRQVVALAAALRARGIEKGDRVAIYMGMVPEAVIAMLACARIGAPHTVVFGGFAAEALADRLNDSGAKAVLTQDGAYRRGNILPLKAAVDIAVDEAPSVETVIVFRRLGQELCPLEMRPGRDYEWAELLAQAHPDQGYAEIVEAEHPLFILYTSGSTGKPKGILHTSYGYLAYAHVTTKYIFDIRDDDIYFCTADVGWITGHTYVTYGPLSNGATVVLYEGAPNQPDWGRFWQIVDKHKVTILYTAPTAIRAFMRAGDEFVDGHDLSSLRLLGSVGEPINPEAWLWYHRKIGRERCPIVDTWWQTETGGIMITTLPGVHATKPGTAGVPFFGVKASVLPPSDEAADPDSGGLLTIDEPWPSMLRGIYGDPERVVQQYFSTVQGHYFSGDGAKVDEDGYIRVLGRTDDVLKLSGHRVGTAEIESCLVGHGAVAEAAAVGRPHDIKGQALVVFVSLKPFRRGSPKLEAELADHIATEIGRFARPDEVCIVPSLPKTRSGKIMRRLLKNIAAFEEVRGDLSTLEDRDVVDTIVQIFSARAR